MDLSEQWARESLCRHGYTTGLLAVKINRALNLGILGEELTAGLIHDFGRMLFILCFPDEFQQVDDLAFDEEMPTVLATEEAVLHVNHCELGAWLLQSNGLPDALVEVVLFHHQPELARDARLTYLTAVCDHMANHVQRHGSTRPYDIQTNPFVQGLENSGVRSATSKIADISELIMESALNEADQFIC
jgi:HD-like signal output (HDOD) protein